MTEEYTSTNNQCPVCQEERDILVPLENCSHTLCILCIVELESIHDFRCSVCRVPFKRGILSRTDSSAINHTISYKNTRSPIWIYKGRTWGWWMFEPSTSAKIERAYKQFSTGEEEETQTIKEGIHTFNVSFSSMKQTRPRTGAKRSIQRVYMGELPTNTKGIAGIPFHINLAKD